MAAQTPKVPQIHFRNFQKANAFSHVQQNVQLQIASVTTALRPYRKLQHFAAILHLPCHPPDSAPAQPTTHLPGAQNPPGPRRMDQTTWFCMKLTSGPGFGNGCDDDLAIGRRSYVYCYS